VFRVGNGNESGGFAGTITGNGSLVKLGNALLELNGASTYSGDTTINAGTLRVGNSTGSATGTGLVTVTNNAALDGTGSVGGAVTVDSGGTIAPGTSVGTLSVSGGLTLNGDFVCEIDGATADQLAVAGTLDVTGGDLEISILNPPTSGSYVIATAGTVTGPFANVTGLPDSYVLSYSAGAVTIEIPDLLYVDENAAPGGDGLSWATAFDDLQDALTLPLTDTDIWVAQGTYLPDTGTDRSAAFQLLDGVEVLGGFPTPDGGTPDPGLGDRDPDAYPTILSGDLDGNDGSGAPTGNNAYHVVTSSGTDATAILDGFTITNGLADGVDADSDGAGLFNVSGSPIVRNCLFTNCVADRAGGGVFNEETDAAPVFEDCTFLSNVGVLGGAMRNRAGCSPTLKRCLFQENTSPTSAGGAMNTGSQCTVTATNCAFLGNRAAKWGGAVNHGATNSTATYTNCLFSGNLADDAADVEEGYGGAIASRNSAVVTLINTTISGNGASHGGGGMMTSNGGNIDLTNSIVWNNLAVGVTTGLSSSYLNYDAGATTTFSHCLVENATATDLSDATNSLDGTDPANDPLFVIEADPATAPTVLGDFRPMVASPALEVGDNAANTEATDLLGNPRIIDEDANGTATIDLGAYENAAPIVQNPVDILNIRFTGESVVDSIDLSEVFSDPLSGTLSFAIVSNDNPSLVSVIVGADGVADLTSTGSESGTATLVFSATNSFGTREHTIVFTLSLPTIYYVDSQAGSGGDGSTWADAFDHLQDALAVVLADDQIWVAQGTYYPDEGSGQTDDDRVASFELIDDVAIYGGFPVGGGDGTFEARDLSTATVLSGDLQQDDDSTGTNDNAYHVVQAASSVTELAILDGFTITAGKANSSLLPNSRKRGGGFYCSGAPVISNCLFNGNFAKTYGGAIYNNSGSSSPNISDCSFSENSADDLGGAIYNTTNASPSITDCSFLDNSADTRGGAIYNSSVKSISILNCSFTGNSSGSTAGAIFNINASATDITGCSFENNSADWGGGAIYNDSVSLAIHNCSFTNNTASDGGAIVNDDASSPYITDCDFSGNSADDDGGAIVNFDGAPEFSSCTFSGNSAAADGGAIYEGSESSASTFINCIFSGNSATNDGGAIYHSSDSVGATLTNCTLSGNSADRGGAFCNLAISASPRSTLTNCTLSGNSAGTNGGAIYNSSASAKPKLINCVIWNNMANGDSTSASASIQNGQSWRYSYCLVANLDLTVTGTANLDGTDPANDPLFFLGVDPATAPTTDGNLRLLAASPAIDIGDNTANTETTDLDGNSRIQGSVIDLGAYENATPYAQDPVQEFEVHIPAGESVPWPLDLADEFTDPLGGTLAFALASNSDPGLVSVTLDANGLADLALSGTGTATLVFSATNAHGTGLLSVTYTLALPATLHVDSQAAPGGDGTSWANAYQHLQDALAVALANDQVWVAQGTYYPDEGTGQANDDRDSTFDLIDGVATYGGFPVGGGDGTFEARDTSAATILSGDLMQDDEPTGTSDNAYHVVQAASSVTEFTLLDGFTITAGNGTGLLCDSSSPTISHCTFSGNEGISGGAIGNFDGSPAFTNCSFSGNKATYGGAMFSALGAPTLINCSFSGNKATADGGALYCSDTLPTLINCIVWNNEANGVSD
ncbi:MAG: hypothetical protein GY720_02030, partial [bacterium]|nr:hypothetical protein [bacterium]